MKMLDRNSYVPLYRQLEVQLLADLDKGVWEAGTSFPSESSLMQQYRVSRATVRKALEGLAQRGRIRKQQGLGTVVSTTSLDELVPYLKGFSADALSQGMTPSHQILALETLPPSNKVSQKLLLRPADTVLHLSRLNLADDKPVTLTHTYLAGPWLATEGIEITAESLGSGSLYQLLLTKYHIRLTRALVTIRAGNARLEDAKALRRSARSPFLLSEIVAFAEDGTPVEYTESIGRSDRHEWSVSIQPEKPSQLYLQQSVGKSPR
jgi:GntR family transcriptional regulator